jgi:hypothetical protein
MEQTVLSIIDIRQKISGMNTTYFNEILTSINDHVVRVSPTKWLIVINSKFPNFILLSGSIPSAEMGLAHRYGVQHIYY